MKLPVLMGGYTVPRATDSPCGVDRLFQALSFRGCFPSLYQYGKQYLSAFLLSLNLLAFLSHTV